MLRINRRALIASFFASWFVVGSGSLSAQTATQSVGEYCFNLQPVSSSTTSTALLRLDIVVGSGRTLALRGMISIQPPARTLYGFPVAAKPVRFHVTGASTTFVVTDAATPTIYSGALHGVSEITDTSNANLAGYATTPSSTYGVTSYFANFAHNNTVTKSYYSDSLGAQYRMSYEPCSSNAAKYDFYTFTDSNGILQ